MAGFEQGWKEYRRLRNTALVVFLGGIPVCVLVAFVSAELLHTTDPAPIILVAWFVLFLVYVIRLQRWRCPRCGECFSATWWYNKSFLARHCVHCGLPKYQP